MKPILKLSAILTLCACTNAPPAGKADRVLPTEYPQVAVLDGLHNTVYVSDVVIDPGPPRQVTVAVRSDRSRKDLDIQYRFIFIDGTGKWLETEPDWQYRTLPARTRVQLRANAMDETAADFRLEPR